MAAEIRYRAPVGMLLAGLLALPILAFAQNRNAPSPSEAKPLDQQRMYKMMSCSVAFDRQSWILLPKSRYDFTIFGGRADAVTKEVTRMAKAAQLSEEQMRVAWDKYDAMATELDPAAVSKIVDTCLADPQVKQVIPL